VTRFFAYAGEALDAIWRNRTRSILTMLGMIVGTSSVIAVLGIGNAASSGIAASLNSFGDPGFYVAVDPKQDDPAAASIQYRDAASVKALAGDIVTWVFPGYQRNYHIKANGIDYIGAVTSANEVILDTLTLHEGRRIGPNEVRGAAHVTLMSRPLERRFFGENGSALGREITIDGVRFTVIGVYDDLKAGIFNNVGGSDYVEIPYTTFHEIAPGPVEALQIYARKGATADEVRSAVVGALRHLHGPHAEYDVQDGLAFLNTFTSTIAIVSLGVTAIGGVALLVAGIGIMNIMLVSVAERTREIGIRKAIGGSRNDIVVQFLFEAVILSLLGGLIGTVLGLGATLLAAGVVSSLVGPAPIPLLPIVAVATGFSVVVGIFFGAYPALRAGRLDPIEALRS
jgi:putative ABC transport system permease protein